VTRLSQLIRPALGSVLVCLVSLSMAAPTVWADAAGAHGAPALSRHAELVSSYPAPGAVVAGTPPEIRLTFNERIGLGSTLQIFGKAFRAVPGVTAGVDPAAPQLLRAIPPPLAPDTYTVEWTAASLDGHTVSGSFAFAVTPAAAAGPSSGPGWLVAIIAAIVAAALGFAAWRITLARRGPAILYQQPRAVVLYADGTRVLALLGSKDLPGSVGIATVDWIP
jgi:methionine-rich copper-binding protein CopC